MGAGAPASLPLGPDPVAVAGAGAARADREPTSRAAGWLRLPGWASRPASSTRATRLLAAADVWHALGEPRPHRPALPPADAARSDLGLPLDRDAVRAVLAAAHGPRPTFPPLPVDLTGRELEVLRLLAAGRTKKQIAARAVHLAVHGAHPHGARLRQVPVTTRAGLAMFAMRHGLAAGPVRAADGDID